MGWSQLWYAVLYVSLTRTNQASQSSRRVYLTKHLTFYASLAILRSISISCRISVPWHNVLKLPLTGNLVLCLRESSLWVLLTSLSNLLMPCLVRLRQFMPAYEQISRTTLRLGITPQVLSISTYYSWKGWAERGQDAN